MGARDLLSRLRSEGFTLTPADGGGIRVVPSGDLTDEHRRAIRAARAGLLALLTGAPPKRPYRLSSGEATRCHATPWDDATCTRFEARVARLRQLGIQATDANDLAERLHLRDLDGDDRRLCLECARYRTGRCSDHKRAGLSVSEVGRDLAALLQRCSGFE